MTINITQVSVKTSDGVLKQFSDYKGKVLLIVNVASKCGFTKQYSGLQKLQDEFGSDNFEVLGFPCNDFGNQEPGTLEEIKQFCSSTYGVNFTIFGKVHAKDTTTEPFTTLNKAAPAGDVAWNFEKFLISKQGEVLKRFKSDVDPESSMIKNAIENALSE